MKRWSVQSLSVPTDKRVRRTLVTVGCAFGATLGMALVFGVVTPAAVAFLLIAFAVCVALGIAVRGDWLRPARPARVLERVGHGDHPDPLQAHAGAMVEMMVEPVILLDDSGRILVANAAARRRFSLSTPGVLLSSVLREPDVLTAVTASAQGGAARMVRFMTLTPHEEHIRAYVAAVAEDTGSQSRRVVMVMLHDETALRRAERLRLDFLANASHELRTPLTSLSGFIETLRGHARDDAKAQEHFLSIMQAQTARMRRLIGDLLSLSRVELYEHVAPSEHVDLSELARELADGLAPLAKDAQVDLQVEDVDQLITVVGVRDELMQVVQNLLENAIKYSPPGGAVRLRVGGAADRPGVEAADLAVAEDEANFAILPPPMVEHGFGWVSVADTGPGIARRHLPRLGERFFRADPESPQAKRGTGLGLAISKHILTRHRGGLLVASTQGAGTAFTMMAPQPPQPSQASSIDADGVGGESPILDDAVPG